MSSLDVSRERLESLLAAHAESAALEYIGDCDLSKRRDVVELATEVAALAARGGSIVIGADDHGGVSGRLDDRKAGLLDEATLADKLARYLPPLHLRVGRHRLDSEWVVLIEVDAHPDGGVVFVGDGTYDHEGAPRTAFRKGELFGRRGTKSQRPDQDEIHDIGRRAVVQSGLWLEELHRLEADITEIGKVADEEGPRAPDGRFGGGGTPTAIPGARRRVAGRLAALEAAGGPRLQQCRELAEGGTFTAYRQFRGAVFAALDEIARYLEQR